MDKKEAEIKAKEKIEKIKENTKLFNEIIKKQTNIDENKDEDMDVEDCTGGVNNEISELQTLQQNKQTGFKRTSPQATPEIIRRIENCEKNIFRCPQCDFLTPSELFFNQHMTEVHTGPNCPFCFLPFKEYSELRRHCTEKHDETKNVKITTEAVSNIKSSWKSKKPCRYFKNGEGNCTPRNGKECEFDHNIIPFSERQECYHKQACQYKPYCIFYHPEGQNVEKWQKNSKQVSKICHFSQQGLACMRSECKFYHPVMSNYQDFPWEHLKKPPKVLNTLEKMRVPVIVKNRYQVNSLSQSLRGLELD